MNACLRAALDLDCDDRFQHAIELIGRRWSGAIIRALLPGQQRFNTLLMGIDGISDRVLTTRLRELRDEGVVERLVDPGPPIAVSYRLTQRGQRLSAVFVAIDAWAREVEP